jgi:hypothetical protein
MVPWSKNIGSVGQIFFKAEGCSSEAKSYEAIFLHFLKVICNSLSACILCKNEAS